MHNHKPFSFNYGDYANYASTSPDLRDGNWHFIAWTLQRCTNGQNLGTRI